MLSAGRPMRKETVFFTGIVERQDVGMLQVRGDLDLLEEPLSSDNGSQLGSQDLDRYLPAVLEILSEVHRRHTTSAQFALDGVTIGEGGGQSVQSVIHSELR